MSELEEDKTGNNQEIVVPEQGSVLPMDQHNQTLLENAHPSDWVNPEPAKAYNLVVIGAGPSGLVAAAGAAGMGAKVALVEQHLMGGDCGNVGCVPSKCMIRSARAAAEVRKAGEFGVQVPEGMAVNFEFVMERMRRLRAQISRNDSVERYTKMGVDVFLGQGRFIDERTIEVGDKKLKFHNAVIATGARAVHPTDVDGAGQTGFLTNETVFNLTQLPPRLVVFGAGPIGCELGQTFARFGSQVTILQSRGQFLPREDPDAAAIIQRAFEKEGIQIQLNARTYKMEKKDGEKVVYYRQNGKECTVSCDEVLIGAGRQPNVDNINLERVAVEYDTRKGVKVDKTFQTTNSRIYAVGDVCSPYKFTHTADASARVVIQNTLFPGHKKFTTNAIPWCTYTDPEIAHVGMYEQDAMDKGIKVQTFVQPLDEVDRAIADGETQGMVKVHVEKGHDRVLGATVVAKHAGEMINELTLAIIHKIGLGKISSVIHPYPTQAEAIHKVADAYNRTRLTPRVKSLSTKWLAVTR
jgi:pyruvate/2-oxoglutarate dehydrogenase complex dihydrolipoamide dehydrogenase (E3) component